MVVMKAENRPGYEFAKRLLETSLALLVLLIFSPLWVAVALAIKLTSPGPVLYRGQVVGRHGRVFTYYKFRSMYADRNDQPHRTFITNYVGQYVRRAELLPTGTDLGNNSTTRYEIVPSPTVTYQNEAQFKLLNDNRVTKVGRVIRKLSIDEIPQLWNVIRGEMALVGPRPPVLYEYNLYDEWCRQRLAVLPGITGLAQVRARGRASFHQMVETDLEYIRNRSIWLDIKILLKTPIVMLKGA